MVVGRVAKPGFVETSWHRMSELNLYVFEVGHLSWIVLP